MSVLFERRGGPDLVQLAGVTVIGRPIDLFAVLRAAHMCHFDGMDQSTGETGEPTHQGQQQGDTMWFLHDGECEVLSRDVLPLSEAENSLEKWVKPAAGYGLQYENSELRISANRN